MDVPVDGDDDLLGEYPQDPEDDLIDENGNYYEEDDGQDLDSDGEPLPTPDQIRDIINSIPSFRFEEEPNGYESSMSMAASGS